MPAQGLFRQLKHAEWPERRGLPSHAAAIMTLLILFLTWTNCLALLRRLRNGECRRRSATKASQDSASRFDDAVSAVGARTALATDERDKWATSRGSSGSDLTSRSRQAFLGHRSVETDGEDQTRGRKRVPTTKSIKTPWKR